MRSRIENFVHFELLEEILERISKVTNSCFTIVRTDCSSIPNRPNYRPFCTAIRDLNSEHCLKSEKSQVDNCITNNESAPKSYICKVASLSCFRVPVRIQNKIDAILLGGGFFISNTDKNKRIEKLNKRLIGMGIDSMKIKELIELTKEIPVINEEKFKEIIDLSETISKYLTSAVESRLDLEKSVKKTKQVEIKLTSYAKNLRLVTKTSQEILLTTDYLNIVEKVANMANEAIGSKRCSIWLFNKPHTRLELMSSSGKHDEKKGEHYYEKGEGLTWHIATSSEIINLKKCSTHPQWKGKYIAQLYPGLYERGGGAFLGIPLRIGGSVLGVIKFGEKKEGIKPYFYTIEDENYARLIATHICSSIVVGKYFREALRKTQEIIEFNKKISSSYSIDSIIKSLYPLKGLSEVIDFFSSITLLWNEERKQLEPVGYVGYSKEFINKNRFEFKPDENYSGYIYSSNESLLIADVKKNKLKPKIKNIDINKPLRSFLGVPLEYDNRVLGVLEVASDVPNSFDIVDKYVLNSISQAMAIAIGNPTQDHSE